MNGFTHIPNVKQYLRAVNSAGESEYFDVTRGNEDLKPEYVIEARKKGLVG